MKEEKKGITGTDIGIICSIAGIIASIILIVMNVVDNDSITVGIILLCACTINLITNVRVKRRKE